MNNDFSKIPSVNSVLENLNNLVDKIDHKFLKRIVENTIQNVRQHPKKYRLEYISKIELLTKISKITNIQAEYLLNPVLNRIINGTGVILHTGLGRAPLGKDLLSGFDPINVYTNLEINIQNGKRGERLDHIIPLLQILTGAEDAVITNNNAAATMLCLNSVANRKEVIISRGELVEIGGSFRMPEVMKSSNAKMIEVGATNKTHLKDYENAINNKTAAIMLVHPSNFEIKGFTQKPETKEIVELAQKYKIPVIYDLGSGALVNMESYGYYHEPTVSEMVDLGIDLISFSGDKLLGGPQAGLIVGKQEIIKKLKKNHLLRALRCDKVTIYLLSKILQTFLHENSLPKNNLTYHYFRRDIDELKRLGDQIIRGFNKNSYVNVNLEETEGKIGSGAYPTFPVKSISLQIEIKGLTTEKIARKFRENKIPIFGYIDSDKFHINLLAIHKNDINEIIQFLNNA